MCIGYFHIIIIIALCRKVFIYYNDFQGLYKDLQGFSGIYKGLPGFTGIYRDFQGLCDEVLSFSLILTGEYDILLK